ncbi:MAG TPA: 2-dehydropantoate 2-reductase [Pseudolysinimonas sp.]|nr:2-dehydropantoate 2-reductase [Pseudolysinimonas sp.]
MTRVAIVGTGANGASIGADMTRAGHDVVFIEQWPAHVEAMRKNGLTVEWDLAEHATEVTEVNAIHLCEVATLRQVFDVVFVIMKAYDTTWATQLIKPLVASDGVVVGLQNGMSVDDIESVMGPERTMGGVIEIASNMFEPGIVHRETSREAAWLAVGGIHPATMDRAGAVAELLTPTARVEVSDDIRSSKWMKLAVNAAELVPSAILDLALADAVALPGMREFMDECAREALRTCIATGSRLVPVFGFENAETDDIDAYARRLYDAVLTHYSTPTTRTTVLQDWMKGRRAEIEEINGFVVREQERVGGHAPHNKRVIEIARRIEAGELEARPENVSLLVQ